MGVGLLVSHTQLRLESIGRHPQSLGHFRHAAPMQQLQSGASLGWGERKQFAQQLRAHLGDAFQAVQKNNGAGRSRAIRGAKALRRAQRRGVYYASRLAIGMTYHQRI